MVPVIPLVFGVFLQGTKNRKQFKLSIKGLVGRCGT